jgi:hypothetical protein
MDLYPKGDEPGPLVYMFDETAGLPMCAVYRVEMAKLRGEALPDIDSEKGKEQVCPFFGFKDDGTLECILGDDRLTQCKADPVCRVSRLAHKRRLSGWSYSLIDSPCMGCKAASETDERNMTVKDWMLSSGMEDRLVESDMFHGFVLWLQGEVGKVPEMSVFYSKLATSLLFDWHRFAIEHLKQPKDEVIKYGPSSLKEVFLSARELTESIIIRDVQQKKDERNGSGSDE